MRRDMNCWIFIRHFRCAYNNVLCNHSSALHGVYVCVCIECIGIQIIIDPVLSVRRKYQAHARTTAQRTFIRFAHSIPHANKTLARTHFIMNAMRKLVWVRSRARTCQPDLVLVVFVVEVVVWHADFFLVSFLFLFYSLFHSTRVLLFFCCFVVRCRCRLFVHSFVRLLACSFVCFCFAFNAVDVFISLFFDFVSHILPFLSLCVRVCLAQS